MRIVGIETSDTPQGGRLTGLAVWDRRALGPDRIDYVYGGVPAAAITGGGDALVASMLIPAMAVGEDIEVEAPVSPRLLESLRKIVFINNEWYPKLRRIRVRPTVQAPPILRPTEVASYFSGGLDSFYTVLRPRDDPITLLFTIVGFDLRFEKRASAPSILKRLEHAAEALERRLVVVDSNAFEIGHKYLFGAEHHGAFLASVPLALGPLVRRCFMPSSWALWRMQKSGSHPAVDPLWSTETLEFIHDGVERSRVEKGLEVVDNPVLLEHLRVCLRRPDLYNCGRCEKCIATMVILHVAGRLDECETFGPLDIGTIRRTPVSATYRRVVGEVLDRVEEPELRAALERAVRLGRLYERLDPLIDVVRRRRLRARVAGLSKERD